MQCMAKGHNPKCQVTFGEYFQEIMSFESLLDTHEILKLFAEASFKWVLLLNLATHLSLQTDRQTYRHIKSVK